MKRVTAAKKTIWDILIVLILGALCPKHVSADEQYWQVKDLVGQADIIATVTVKELDKKSDDLMIYVEHPGRGGYSVRHNPDYNEFMDVKFLVNQIFKADNKDLPLLTLTIPVLKGRGRSPKPISFIVAERYLIFLKYGDSSRSPQSLRLLSFTSSAVHLQGNETIRNPHLLDGYLPAHRKFNEPELLQRVQQLISTYKVLRNREVSDKAGILMIQGYSIDTPEQIIEATKSESFMIRLIALEMLIQQTGQKAIPTLGEVLNDLRIEVRWRAAHWLGTLGDKSGLERMRRDLKELAPNNGAPMPFDPNIVEDSRAMMKRENERNNRLYYAIKVAKVLAELGDRRGYELAARRASEKEYRHRYRAVPVLVEIAKTDEAILRAEGIYPVSILCTMAGSEKNEKVFNLLTKLVAMELQYDIGIRILKIAKDSPNQSESAREEAQRHLDTLKLKKKATEKSSTSTIN